MKYELLLNLAVGWDQATSEIKFFTRVDPSSLLEAVFVLFFSSSEVRLDETNAGLSACLEK